MAPHKPYRVFETEGKIEAWIAEGKPVHVWRNADLSSRDVGGLAFTCGQPGQTMETLLSLTAEEWNAMRPHWRYQHEYTTADPADFVFFKRIGLASGIVRPKAGEGAHRAIVKRSFFSYSPAGLAGAWRACEALQEANEDDGYSAPIGRVYCAFTVQALHLASAETREDGRALASQSGYGVIEWSAIIRYDTGTQAPVMAKAKAS